MSGTHSSEKPLPIRQTDDGQWEVENSPGHWTKCGTKADATAISNAPLLLERSFNTDYPNERVAAELEKTAAVLEKYKIGFGSRYFRRRAKVVRCEDPDSSAL